MAREVSRQHKMMRGSFGKTTTSILGLLVGLNLSAQEVQAQQQTSETDTLLGGVERMQVVGSREKKFLIPGAATVLGEEEIVQFEFADIHRLMRQIPGVNIQEEDGYGLRPNIGLRGSGVERSERITLMEDGILIAPAPYAAPAAYYFPTAGRLAGVEVRKGSSSIKFGPRTTGGAINLISTPIPEDYTASLTARAGEYGFREIHGIVGLSAGNIATMAETFQATSNGFKTLPMGGNTGFDLEDYLGKVRIRLGEDGGLEQTIMIKAGLTDQTSNETYFGLTDADFAADPYARYAASQLDQFNSTHSQIQVTHDAQFTADFSLTTTGYYNYYERDWFKLDDLNFGDGRGRIRPGDVFADPDDPLNIAALAILRGEANSVDDALQLRHNSREYYSWGLQTIAGYTFESGDISHDLEIGLRYHEDQEDRLQNRENFKMENGVLVPTSVDPAGSQANRVAGATAFSAYIQDQMTWGQFIFVPGIRLETIELIRTDYDTADPERLLAPTGMLENDLTVFLPGLGVVYQATENTSLLAGVHKGFAPPSPSDSSAMEEESIAYEAGVRHRRGNMFLEAVAFFNDYSNLLGTCTNAIGCTVGDIGDQFNGGKVHVYGLELSASTEAELTDNLYGSFALAYTYTGSEFRQDFTNGFWGTVVKGDELPYMPNHQLTITAGLESGPLSGYLTANYVSEARAVAGQGAISAMNEIPGRLIVDIALHYELTDNVRLFASVENVFDKTYIAARRPYGLRPGKPQTVIGGLDLTF